VTTTSIRKHDRVGDRRAIGTMLVRELGIEAGSQYASDLYKLIGRVYYGQRSGFVHDAQLRHGEQSSKVGYPVCMPGKRGQYRAEYGDVRDLYTLREIVSWAILAWLDRRSPSVRIVPSGRDHLPRLSPHWRVVSEGVVRSDRMSQITPGVPESE